MESILVTGIGGGVGQSILKSLEGSGYRVIGADGDPHAAGLYAVERGYRIPYAASEDFIDRLLAICAQERCRVLLPGLDAELPALSRATDRFAAIGCHVMVSRPEVVQISDDKLLTADFLSTHGFHAPATVPLGADTVGQIVLPVVLKPRRGGARSRGVFVIRRPEDLAAKVSELAGQDYVAQEFIDGDEYTCGTISVDGSCHGVILMRRILRDGDTYKAFVVRDAALEQYVSRVIDALRPNGACNVQLRVREGRPYVFEFNARCSGTTHCRRLAGFNEPLMVIEHVLNGKKPVHNVRSIAILRHWQELLVTPDRIESLMANGVVEGDGSSLVSLSPTYRRLAGEDANPAKGS